MNFNYTIFLYNKGVVKLYVKKAKNIKEKIQGLIGKEKPIPLLLETHFGIHTFGLKFPIDVIILNNKNKIVCLKENLKPDRIYLWNPLFKNVLELPRETIKKKKLKINNVIDISCKDY